MKIQNLDIEIESKYYNKKFTYQYDEDLFKELKQTTGIELSDSCEDITKTSIFSIKGDKRRYSVLNYDKTKKDYEDAEYDAIDLENQVLHIIPIHTLETLNYEFTTLYFTNQGILGMSQTSYNDLGYGLSEKFMLIPILGTDEKEFLWNIAPIIDEYFDSISDSEKFYDIYCIEKNNLETIELECDFLGKTINYDVIDTQDFFNKSFELYYTNNEDFYVMCPRTYKLFENLDKQMEEDYIKRKQKQEKINTKNNELRH